MIRIVLIVVVLFACLMTSARGEPTPDKQLLLRQLEQSWDAAASQFQPPPKNALADARQRVLQEAQLVEQRLDREGDDYAAAWKRYLHWELLARNLSEERQPNYGELARVRRWLYSNREGLELPLFESLRREVDRYLNVVYSVTHHDLQAAYEENVARARELSLTLLEQPTAETATELGRHLGWLERTGHSTPAVRLTRETLSHPNLQVRISAPLVQRIIATQETKVSQSTAIRETVQAPGGLLNRSGRPVDMSGTARISGEIDLKPIPNNHVAELQVGLQGQIAANCRADAGPVSLQLRTFGPVTVTKPLYLEPKNLQWGSSRAEAQVQSQIVNVWARNGFVERLGEWRTQRPEMQAHLQASARVRTERRLTDEFDRQAEAMTSQLSTQFREGRRSVGRSSAQAAAMKREGALPQFHSSRSETKLLQFNWDARRIDQFGAATLPDSRSSEDDIRVALHMSFLNNTAETMLGGKLLRGPFFAKYAKAIYGEVPPELRTDNTESWGLRLATLRPLTVDIVGHREFAITLQVAEFILGERTISCEGQIVVRYKLKSQDSRFELMRHGNLEVTTLLSDEQNLFLENKLASFFGEVIPLSEILPAKDDLPKALQSVHLSAMWTEDDWLILSARIAPMALAGL